MKAVKQSMAIVAVFLLVHGQVLKVAMIDAQLMNSLAMKNCPLKKVTKTTWKALRFLEVRSALTSLMLPDPAQDIATV